MFIDIYNTDKKYKIIYADPPWKYRTSNSSKFNGLATQHYQTMSIEELANLPINNIADDSILFMWATFPTLPDALELLKKWGFVYKTVAFTWVKVSQQGKPIKTLGFWTRSNCEICLLATKGKKYPRRINKDISQVIMAPKREHSQKPDVVRDLIVNLLGDIPRIELFARQHVDGWDCWGNEV